MKKGTGKREEQQNRSKRRRDTSAYGTADWAGADAELLRALICGVGFTGGAVRFGYTSDGGAYALGFYDGDDKWTEYIRPTEDLNEVLRELYEAWRS